MLADRLRYFLGILMAIPVFPIMYAQARQLKKTFPDLPEARNKEGETNGTDELKILMLGESSIAGVGVDINEHGISGQMSEELSRLSAKKVYWQVTAKSGYTAQQVREELVPQIPERAFDVIVIGMGGNDTFKLNTPWFWKESMRSLVLSLHKKHPEAEIVITCMPPVHTFIAFAPLIRFFLGNLTKLLGREMKRMSPEYPYLHYFDYVVSMEVWLKRANTKDTSVFFSDGVHPSALTYQLWGQDTARFIYEHVLRKQEIVPEFSE